MLITLAEFANVRGVKLGTLYKYLARHTEIVRAKKGKDMVFDTEDPSFGILDEAYPIPKPVQVITGVDPEEYRKLLMEQKESLRQIAILQERITQLTQANGQLMLENAEAKVVQLRLEDREKELDAAKYHILKKESELVQAKSDLSQTVQALQDEKNRNDGLMKRTLWQRIMNQGV